MSDESIDWKPANNEEGIAVCYVEKIEDAEAQYFATFCHNEGRWVTGRTSHARAVEEAIRHGRAGHRATVHRVRT